MKTPHTISWLLIFGLALLDAGVTGAQPLPIASGVFTLKEIEQSKLTGSTTFFETFEGTTQAIMPGEKSKKNNTTDHEVLIIVKEGHLGVKLDKKETVIGPGSIAYIMPDETFSLHNSASGSATFYVLKFKSKNPINKARSQRSGGSFIVNWDTLSIKENERGGRRDFFDKSTAMCINFEMHVSTLNEGLPSHPPHTHPAEEIILMKKGDATMSIDNKDYPGHTGDLFFLASESLHGIRNTGKGQCEYFAFQWK